MNKNQNQDISGQKTNSAKNDNAPITTEVALLQKDRGQASIQTPLQQQEEQSPKPSESPKSSKPADPPKPPQASIKEIMSLSDKKDKIIAIVAFISSILFGGTMPMFGVLFGNIANEFDPYGSEDELDENVKDLTVYFLIFGFAFFVLNTVSVSSWIIFGERLGMKYRYHYLKAILSQEVKYFDENKPEEIPTKLSTSCTTIINGIGHKTGTVLNGFGMLLIGILFALYNGWQLALTILVISPLLTLGTFLLIKLMRGAFMDFLGKYGVAGGFVQQALGSIKTVVAFGGEKIERDKYKKALVGVMESGKMNSRKNALALAFYKFVVMFFYCFGFFFGSIYVKESIYIFTTDKDYDSGSVLVTLFCMVYASFSIGAALPGLAVQIQGRISAKLIVDLIKKTKEELKQKGTKIIPDKEFTGKIEFKDVSFEYPTRKEVPILKNVNAVFYPQKKIAICGESGCGKSTIIQLIQGFYNPTKGKILVDGYDLKDLDIQWFRKKIGFVQQEPVLFNMSIHQNICFAKENASDQEVREACRKANILDFIDNLSENFNTNAGEAGSQMSGGQKQRIAIARAIIKQPRILLLDESTSALDSKGEKEVLGALDNVTEGITTISIAHRLTTIQNSDHIYMIKDGTIAEEGSPNQLLENKGPYWDLYNRQIGEFPENSSQNYERENLEEVKKI